MSRRVYHSLLFLTLVSLLSGCTIGGLVLDAKICEKKLETPRETGRVEEDDRECELIFTYLGLYIDYSVVQSFNNPKPAHNGSSTQEEIDDIQESIDNYQKMQNQAWYLDGASETLSPLEPHEKAPTTEEEFLILSQAKP